MTLGDKINEIRKSKGISIDELSVRSGIPKGTLSKITAGITANPTLENVKAIARALECTLDVFDDNPAKPTLSQAALNVATKYDNLDLYGKKTIDAILNIEEERVKNQQKYNSEKDIIYLNFAQGAASAGLGNTLFGDLNDEPLAVLSNHMTEKADFVTKVKGDSMLPIYSNGDIVLVSKEPVDNGEIGLFVVNGEGFIKKKGTNELISVNPKFKNVTIREYDTVYCMGKVIGKLYDDWII